MANRPVYKSIIAQVYNIVDFDEIKYSKYVIIFQIYSLRNNDRKQRWIFLQIPSRNYKIINTKLNLTSSNRVLISEISLYIYIYTNEMEDFIGYSSNEFRMIKIF